MGSDWVIRDQPNDCTLGNDYITQKFLQQKGTSIPLVDMHRFRDSDDKFHFVVMSRAKGKMLQDAWRDFTAEQMKSVATQLGGYIRQWRQFTSPRMQKVDGTQLEDILVGECSTRRIPSCKKIGYSESEWLDYLSPELRRGIAKIDNINLQDTSTLDRRLQELKDRFPKGGPYVLTHANLTLSNIWVDSNARITAILDWESAGFYPWWVEHKMATLLSDSDSHPIRQFWGHIEQDLCPGYVKEDFRNDVIRPLVALRDAYHACPVMHDSENHWTRTPFCKCKPYTGCFRERDLGYPNGIGHRILEEHEEHTDESRERFGEDLDARMKARSKTYQARRAVIEERKLKGIDSDSEESD
jgi:hypothetical protein